MIPPRIEKVEGLDDYKLKIIYANGEKRLYDMKKNLQYDFYKRLNNIVYFKMVKSVETTVEWANGEDIGPNELYDNSVQIY